MTLNMHILPKSGVVACYSIQVNLLLQLLFSLSLLLLL